MAIVVKPVGISQEEANWAFKVATEYLRQSDLAAFLLSELESLPETLTVEVGTADGNTWSPPSTTSKTSAGTVRWNVKRTLTAIDRPGERPDVAWAQKVGKDVLATMSPALLLMHELGHACQFMTDKKHFRERLATLDARTRLDIENINVNAIENTVANELIAKGHAEGIRWEYRSASVKTT